MTETRTPSPESPLYGGGTLPKAPEPQGAWDLLIGIFTCPREVFERLRQSPSFVPALLMIMIIPLVALFLWAHKVDVAANTEHQIETFGRLLGKPIPQQAIDDALSKVHGQPYVKTLAGHLFGVPIIMAIQALLVWAFALMGRREEDGEATFGQAFAVVTVQALVMIPTMLVTAVVLAVKPFGGTSLMLMTPTHLAYFVQPDSLLLQGVFAILDPLYLWSWVLLFLGMKHTLKARPIGIVLLMALFGLFGAFGRIMGGMF